MEDLIYFYTHPIQVKVKENDITFGGIVYGHWLIDGRDGMLYNLDEYLKDKDVDETIIEMSWLDISPDILDK